MCGITGYFSSDTYSTNVLELMTRSLSTRGSDAEGFYSGDEIHLGHRRLSIIDVEGSPQPIFNEDESIVLVFNGEIYNYKRLRQDLFVLAMYSELRAIARPLSILTRNTVPEC